MESLFLLLLTATIMTAGAGYISRNWNPNVERIITDIRSVSSGVPVDYRSHERRINAPGGGGALSAPGCPKSDVGYPWVYYIDDYKYSGMPIYPSKCYLAGQAGPCPDGQILFVERGNPVGFCYCDCKDDSVEDTNVSEPKPNQGQFCFVGNPWNKKVVIFPASKICYQLFERGPCKENEWLVRVAKRRNDLPAADSSAVVKCEERKCPEGQITASLLEGNYEDVCSPPPPGAGATPVLENGCPEGTKYSSLLEKCVKKFTFLG
jgi:hypothetical protein